MPKEIVWKHCPECGGLLKVIGQGAGGADVRRCSDCGRRIHPDPKMAVASLIFRDGRLLLLQRARPPQKGLWCLPGGFVDRGETLEAAAVREAREETGLDVELLRLHGLYSYPGYEVIVAIYEARITGGTEEYKRRKPGRPLGAAVGDRFRPPGLSFHPRRRQFVAVCRPFRKSSSR